MRRLAWLLPVLALTAGCWSPRYFSPREHRDAIAPSGDLAATYEVRSADGARRGEVRVWSQGAKARWNEADEEVVELHVGFELENHGDGPLELDVPGLRCDDVRVDGEPPVSLLPIAVRGDPIAAPGTTARLDVLFQPPTTRPSRLDGFAVRFAVRVPGGEAVSESTPFGPDSRGSGYRYYYGDPWWPGYGGPYWGWGGWGWGGWGWWGGYYRCWP